MQITINAKTLKVRELRALEQARTFDDMCAWLARNGGVAVEEVEECTLSELMQITADLQTSIKDALSLPKQSGGN